MTIGKDSTIIVTGGAGFIGSAVVRHLINDTGATVVNVDKLTYAGSLDAVAGVSADPRYRFEKVDICDAREISRVFREHRPTAVMHLAAESHVDRSIGSPADFIQTNIIGTYSLLEVARAYWSELQGQARRDFRFLHVSTDEVYGTLGWSGRFTEDTPYQPNSPYSASKASSDHLVRAWHHTYGLPAVTTNCSNNYGPYQFPEKLIPLMILNALQGKALPVYGKGENVRDWLYVEDHAGALRLVLDQGRPGETYNVGGNSERSNLDVVKAICACLDELRPRGGDGDSRAYASLISFVEDRPGHDLRYAIDATKIGDELGWRPGETFETGLRKTIQWYLENGEWWQKSHERGYRGERLGLISGTK